MRITSEGIVGEKRTSAKRTRSRATACKKFGRRGRRQLEYGTTELRAARSQCPECQGGSHGPSRYVSACMDPAFPIPRFSSFVFGGLLGFLASSEGLMMFPDYNDYIEILVSNALQTQLRGPRPRNATRSKQGKRRENISNAEKPKMLLHLTYLLHPPALAGLLALPGLLALAGLLSPLLLSFCNNPSSSFASFTTSL
jgi:hypothetical protein